LRFPDNASVKRVLESAMDFSDCVVMRIGIDCRTILASQRGFRRLTSILTALARLDKDNEYRLFTTDDKALDELQLPGNFVREDPHRRFRMLHRKWASFYGRLFFSDIDAFHFPTADVWYAHYTPTVVTLHDLAQLRYPEKFFANMQDEERYRAHLEMILANADAVATVSEFARNDIMEKLDWPPDKLHTVYQGFPDFGEMPRSRAREEYLLRRFECSPGFVLYSGGLDFRKNVETLLRAYRIFRDQAQIPTGGRELVVVGSLQREDPNMYPDLEEIAVEEGIASHVRFTGFLEDNDLAAMYRLAGVFAYPSVCEGFGFSPLEAMSCSLPVVCSSATALPETVGDGALLCEPLDLESWAQALESMLSDQDLRDSVIERGHANLKRFSWEKTARSFIDLYNAVAS
jgi:glycosyltransferase involved in cell wall biosynthesis